MQRPSFQSAVKYKRKCQDWRASSPGLFQFSQGLWGPSEGQLGQGPPTRRFHALPASWSSPCPTPRKRKLPCGGSCCKKYLEAGEGPGGTLAWWGLEGNRRCWGAEPGLGWEDLGAQAAKASVPADPSQRQESPPPCWERGSCRDVRSKHLRTSGSRNCSQGPASQGV